MEPPLESSGFHFHLRKHVAQFRRGLRRDMVRFTEVAADFSESAVHHLQASLGSFARLPPDCILNYVAEHVGRLDAQTDGVSAQLLRLGPQRPAVLDSVLAKHRLRIR
jgi:hypothetical protein